MPNVGRPSRDCHLCRQRRVKCDLRQPECERCAKLGRKCPGYRDESDLMFRLEDPASFADGANRDRRRRRGEATPPVSRNTSKSPTSLSANEMEVVLPPNQTDALFSLSLHGLPQPPAESWHLPLFFNTLMPRLQRNMAFGLLGFLPDMVAAARPDSPVGLAVQAISCAFHTTRTSDPEARTRRSITYGKALTSTNAALRDQSLQTRDDTVTSVWLLSLYEVNAPFRPRLLAWLQALIVGSSPPQMHVGPATWNLHTQGMATLLQLRGTAGFDSVVGRNLFWLLFNSVQIRCLVTGQSCPPESIHWLRELEKHQESQDMPSLQMSLYGCHASALCEKIRNFVDNESSNSPSLAFEILWEAEALDADTTYDALIPRPATYETSLLLDPVAMPQPNFQAPFVRTFFCGFRLKFLLCVSELLAKIQDLSSDPTASALPSQIQHNISAIQNVADEILASAPHIFRSEGVEERTKTGRPRFWMDGLRLLWPLRLVAFWPATRPDQKQSAAAMLQSIREELGVLQATQDFAMGSGRSYPATRMSPPAMRR